MEEEVKKWKEPNFAEWVEENYVRKDKNRNLNWEDLNKSDYGSFDLNSEDEIHVQKL